MDTPESTLDDNDRGDETGLRFRYQYCYVAINAVRLLSHSREYASIICENFEDFLLQRQTGGFVAVQVKTRAPHLSPFRTYDSQVINALLRFSRLDGHFIGAFEQFEFATNHRFWREKQDSNNLPWVLSELKKRGHVKHLRSNNPMRQLVDSLSASSGIKQNAIVRVLLKVNLSARSDAIKAIVQDLRDVVAEYGNLSEEPFSVVARIAKALEQLVAEASTKNFDGGLSDLYAAGKNFEEILKDGLLQGKRIIAQDVKKVIETQIDIVQTPETLNIAGIVAYDELPNSFERMIIKMARGGVHQARVQEMQDLVYAFTEMYMRWVRKYGTEVAEQRYEDLLARVQMDCVEARVEGEANGEPYGSMMYERIVERVRERVRSEVGSLYGCRPEHLLGAAGILTESCKTWWSREFDPMESGGAFESS